MSRFHGIAMLLCHSHCPEDPFMSVKEVTKAVQTKCLKGDFRHVRKPLFPLCFCVPFACFSEGLSSTCGSYCPS